jgi:predicted DNA-binding protein
LQGGFARWSIFLLRGRRIATYTLLTMVMTTVSVRLDEDMAERLDKIAAKAEARQPGAKFKRSDALRMAVEQGLRVLEKDLRIAAPRPKPRP